MVIGVTERGDPSLDSTWIEKMDDVDGAIIITKNLTDKIIETVLKYKEKVIVHATCTGYGGTVVEPRIPIPPVQLSQLNKLVEQGFPKEQIVIRVDPIIPTDKGLNKAISIIKEFIKYDYKRFRISLLDAYPHVRKRFQDNGLELPYGNNFSPSKEQIFEVNNQLIRLKNKYPDIIIECCAEPDLTEAEYIGCISEKDFELLGLDVSEVDEVGYQRKYCKCCSAKTELLREKKYCPYKCVYCYGCLYCYWK